MDSIEDEVEVEVKVSASVHAADAAVRVGVRLLRYPRAPLPTHSPPVPGKYDTSHSGDHSPLLHPDKLSLSPSLSLKIERTLCSCLETPHSRPHYSHEEKKQL
jgi:hypothetical protein